MPKKVLHLVSSYGISGVNSNLKIIACKLKDRDWQPQLYHYGYRNGTPRHFFDGGLSVNRIPGFPGWLKYLKTRWVVSYLKQVLRKFRPDIVHAHSFDADLVALRACAGTQIPVVITCQSFSYLDWAKRYSDHYRRWKRQLGIMVSVTRMMAEEIKSLPVFADIPQEVIYNVPAERFFCPPDGAARAASRKQLGIEPEEVLITCTATFHPIKGHIVLADAFSTLAATNRHAKLILIGDTLGQPEYLKIKEQVEESLNHPMYCGRIQIIEGCHDAEPVLRATDIYVQPSFMEALSVATAEAMAMGISVVVSGVGGLKEMVTEGVTGFQVEPGESQQLANALQRLIDNPPLRRRIGAAASSYAKTHFSPDVAAERYAAVYARALNS
jgi:glycosyltransferase involved in cell wall biosynthesis